MESKEFIIGEEVIYKGHEDWGKGTVEMLFGDGSVLICFPHRPDTHPTNTNRFRYYSYELKYFIKGN
jgi:hypothetical protein